MQETKAHISAMTGEAREKNLKMGEVQFSKERRQGGEGKGAREESGGEGWGEQKSCEQ